ncbi:hypothetical protein JQ597_11665 [Bradyrhizobium sp. AUGA SZCCT0177]|uniref:hypothetical protein n=1 Tax=Bradyrhizobium sp. AUGA SZCCT0177 TaxID=2807665 RepID=UPI001BACED88|nr:hypothetical protein [Bradyrhizobium sp. AUGA SZCCT0177]MBR1282694.1 hypothetical protein [Bradyrhizobium sp. AUGA SZCCT0177]
MPNEPSPESIARAARLRKQIDQLTNTGAPSDQPKAREEKRPMSPREFIERKMRELDGKK